MAEPLLIGVEATRHCNLRCVHCLRADTRTRGELPLPLFERLLTEAHAYGRPHIALTGGEPTLHSRFFDLLGAVAAHGFSANLVTNGQGFADLVADLGRHRELLSSVSFSLDGATAAVHEALRGPGTYARVLLAIAVARHRGFRVLVQLTVNRRNRPELAAVARLCGELGVRELFVSHAQPTPELYAAGLQLSPAEWREVEAEVRGLAAGKGVRPRLSIGAHDPGALAPCMALMHQSLNVDWRGRLTFCCQLSGVGGGESDVLADLEAVSLAEAHRRLLGVIDRVLHERLAMLGGGAAADNLDAFQCWFCQKRFGKVEWLARYPDDPWVAGEPHFAARRERTP